MNSIVDRSYSPSYLPLASGGVAKITTHDRKRLWEYLPLPSTPHQLFCVLCNSWIVLQVIGPNGRLSPLLGSLFAGSSFGALTEFYLTKRFVINRKPQVVNIVKFVAATAFLGYLSWQYFKLPLQLIWIEKSIEARITAYMGRHDATLIERIYEPNCGGAADMPRDVRACFMTYLEAAADRVFQSGNAKKWEALDARIEECFPYALKLRTSECGWTTTNPLKWTLG